MVFSEGRKIPKLILIKKGQMSLSGYMKRYWLSALTIGATGISLLDKQSLISCFIKLTELLEEQLKSIYSVGLLLQLIPLPSLCFQMTFSAWLSCLMTAWTSKVWHVRLNLSATRVLQVISDVPRVLQVYNQLLAMLCNGFLKQAPSCHQAALVAKCWADCGYIDDTGEKGMKFRTAAQAPLNTLRQLVNILKASLDLKDKMIRLKWKIHIDFLHRYHSLVSLQMKDHPKPKYLQ